MDYLIHVDKNSKEPTGTTNAETSSGSGTLTQDGTGWAPIIDGVATSQAGYDHLLRGCQGDANDEATQQ